MRCAFSVSGIRVSIQRYITLGRLAMRVAETVERTKNHIARCARISNLLALWTMTTPEAELKSVFARHLYWAVQSSERLGGRLAELRGGLDPPMGVVGVGSGTLSAS